MAVPQPVPSHEGREEKAQKRISFPGFRENDAHRPTNSLHPLHWRNMARFAVLWCDLTHIQIRGHGRYITLAFESVVKGKKNVNDFRRSETLKRIEQLTEEINERQHEETYQLIDELHRRVKAASSRHALASQQADR